MIPPIDHDDGGGGVNLGKNGYSRWSAHDRQLQWILDRGIGSAMVGMAVKLAYQQRGGWGSVVFDVLGEKREAEEEELEATT